MKQKRIRRFAPCPSYDVEKIESWLTDMAKEGWILEKDSDIFGWLAFTKEAPRNLRYRLEPQEEGIGFGDTPDPEVRQLCEEYDWEYVDSYGKFFIYRATRSDAREMNTDLQVQAAAMKASKRNSTVSLILDFILLGNLFSDFLRMPFRSLAVMGFWFHFIHILTLVWVSIDSFLHWRHLRKLQKQLKENIPLDHRKPWRKGAAFHIFSKFAYILVIFLFFGILFGACSQALELEVDAPATDDYPSDPPFVTAADILPEGEFTSRPFPGDYNTYVQTGSFFAPRIFEWNEHGEILLSDGTTYDGILRITYYETRYPWLAEGLIKDLYREAEDQHHFAILPASELDVDQVLCYNAIYPSILIRQGNIVVQATVGLENKNQYLLEQWAQQMAKMLKSE